MNSIHKQSVSAAIERLEAEAERCTRKYLLISKAKWSKASIAEYGRMLRRSIHYQAVADRHKSRFGA